MPPLVPHIPVAPKPDYAFGKFGPRNPKNKYRGVGARGKDRYSMCICSSKFHGKFEREEDAARAYDLAAVFLGRGCEWLNFPAEIETRRQELAAARVGKASVAQSKALDFVKVCLRTGVATMHRADKKGLKAAPHTTRKTPAFIDFSHGKGRSKTKAAAQGTPQRQPTRKREAPSKFKDFLFDQTGEADLFTAYAHAAEGGDICDPGQVRHVARPTGAEGVAAGASSSSSSSSARTHGDGPHRWCR